MRDARGAAVVSPCHKGRLLGSNESERGWLCCHCLSVATSHGLKLSTARNKGRSRLLWVTLHSDVGQRRPGGSPCLCSPCQRIPSWKCERHPQPQPVSHWGSGGPARVPAQREPVSLLPHGDHTDTGLPLRRRLEADLLSSGFGGNFFIRASASTDCLAFRFSLGQSSACTAATAAVRCAAPSVPSARASPSSAPSATWQCEAPPISA